jgi:hypothetical protein
MSHQENTEQRLDVSQEVNLEANIEHWPVHVFEPIAVYR